MKNGRAKICVHKKNDEKNKSEDIKLEVDVSLVKNNNTSLRNVFIQLQLIADKYKIPRMRIKRNDILFQLYKAQEFKELARQVLKTLKLIITPSPKFINDPEEQCSLIERYHNDLILGGHPGKKRLLAKLQQSYMWKSMARDVAKFVENCDSCILNKIRKGNKENLVLTETSQKPFDKIIIDTIGPLETSTAGNKYALTIICDLTKYVIAGAMPNKEAVTVAKTPMNHFILIYGKPKDLPVIWALSTKMKFSKILPLC